MSKKILSEEFFDLPVELIAGRPKHLSLMGVTGEIQLCRALVEEDGVMYTVEGCGSGEWLLRHGVYTKHE